MLSVPNKNPKKNMYSSTFSAQKRLELKEIAEMKVTAPHILKNGDRNWGIEDWCWDVC